MSSQAPRPRVTLRQREVAATTGVSLTTVKGWCTSGQLPCIRVGGVVLIAPADLEAFLAAHREGNNVAPLARHTARRPGRTGGEAAT